MKKLANLRGVKTLSKEQQLTITGSRKPGCQVGCAGLSHGAFCWATGTSPNCSCEGMCSGGVCNPY